MKLIPNPVFQAPIAFHVPGGNPDTVLFNLRHKSAEGLDAWLKDRDKSAVGALEEIVDSWVAGQVVDESGAAVPYSPAALSAFLLASPTRPSDLLKGYLKELRESRVKN